MRRYLLLPAALSCLGAPAVAHDRDFCANRPGIGTPACTMAPGTAMIETGVAEWDHSAGPGGSEDDTALGQFLLRVGVSESAEVQFGFDSYTLDRTFDRAGRLVARSSGVGDAFFAVRRGVAGPNGPVAIEGFVSTPANDARQWTAGLLLPTGVDLPAGFKLAVTPEVDLAADANRHGRHVAYGGVVGFSHALATDLTAGGELAAFEDSDPAGHSLDARWSGSLAWQVSPRLQVDFEADAGLSAGAPHSAVMIGFADRFR